MSKLFVVAWPAFMIAAIAEFLFVFIIDPKELYLMGEAVQMSTLATYSFGVVAFWLVAAASSFATWYLMRSPRSINMETAQSTHPTP